MVLPHMRAERASLVVRAIVFVLLVRDVSPEVRVRLDIFQTQSVLTKAIGPFFELGNEVH